MSNGSEGLTETCGPHCVTITHAPKTPAITHHCLHCHNDPNVKEVK